MKILLLTTYPVSDPKHGGQLRVKNIMETYEACGHSVKIIGVCGSDHYQIEPGFLAFPGYSKLSTIHPNPFLMEDYVIGKLCLQEEYYKKLANLITDLPDVIQVEHPWLFEFAQKYINSSVKKIKLVYSSHNIEYELKKQILEKHFDQAFAIENSLLVKALEENAVHKSDAVSCVSVSDFNKIKSFRELDVFLAPNGVSPWSSHKANIRIANEISQGFKYALYCASAHPPNVEGFFNMLKGPFGSLKPDEKLVLVGDVGYSVGGDDRVHKSFKLAEKIIIAGRQSKKNLDALLDNAQCIILPITDGGGTNLKTAEAIYSNKPIVATTKAMRGFESFMNADGVWISDNEVEFKSNIRSAMALDSTKISRKNRDTVIWEKTLLKMPVMIENLFMENIDD